MEFKCQAIIQSGPRRGQACGRPCWGRRQFCLQYHANQEPVEPVELVVPEEVSRESLREPIRESLREPVLEPLREPVRVNYNPPDPIQVEVSAERKTLVLEELNRLGKTKKSFFWFCSDDDSLEDFRVHTDDCPICTCQPLPKEKWVKLPCQHSFHVMCIRGWVESFQLRDRGCPMCRNPITLQYQNIEGFRT